jgi:hypothetical protein
MLIGTVNMDVSGGRMRPRAAWERGGGEDQNEGEVNGQELMKVEEGEAVWILD